MESRELILPKSVIEFVWNKVVDEIVGEPSGVKQLKLTDTVTDEASTLDVTGGLKLGGRVLINSDRPPDYYADLAKTYTVMTVDAGSIAREHGLGSKTQPIVNTAILGAFARVLGLVSLDSVIEAILDGAPVQPHDNAAAARQAFDSVAAEVPAIESESSTFEVRGSKLEIRIREERL